MGEPALERLRQGPVVCDGAMGTMLYARAAESQMHGRCFDELTLTNPALVQDVHRAYIQAGAHIIETNTFGANQAKLSAYGLGDRVREINMRAAQLAREAREIAGQTVFVAGAVGPSGLLNLPTQSAPGAASSRHRKGDGSAEDEAHEAERRLASLRAIFREQIEALVVGGVDLLILETISSLADQGQRAMAALGVDGVGVNCSMGPAGILDAVTEMAEALRTMGATVGGDIILTAQPNAGLPTRIENRFLYVSTPHYFADYARRFAATGAGLIGGCCGTTPAHIAAMRAALAESAPATISYATTPSVTAATGVAASAATPITESAQTPSDATPRTRLQAALEAGRFVVSAELDPPKGLNPQKILDGAAYLREMGVEYINIADSPMARVRMSCLALARLLRDRLDIEPIVHVTTRDRNLMALQSDLMGAHALGIHNILALTGDPVRAGNYPNLTGVWDVDSVGLLRILGALNEGRDAAGASLGTSAHFFCGAALNLNMEDRLIDVEGERARGKLAELGDLDDYIDASALSPDHTHHDLTETALELHRLRHKLDAGAQYIMTQPIYDLEPLERFLAAFGPAPVPIILGMIPLHSSKHAEYLHNEVPGISIPDAARERMRAAGDQGREVGIQMAYEVITAARASGLIQGCYLMPSYGRYDLVGELARELLREAAPV